MKIKTYSLLGLCSFMALVTHNATADVSDHYATEFKGATQQVCDNVFHKTEKNCDDMICRDVLVNAWAECWHKSMNTELNKRLMPLKDADMAEFHAEMDLQKSFNVATTNLCGKSCDEMGDMKGIPYNFCRVDAYKYRTAQAIQINEQRLTIPLTGKLTARQRNRGKEKDTAFFKAFTEKLCLMPKTVWQGGLPPVTCQKSAYSELNAYDFTDDVCNLS